MIATIPGLLSGHLTPPLAGLATALSGLTARASAATGNTFMWYATRAAAVGAYVLVTLTVLFGLARSLAHVARIRVSWLLEENHQTLAAITAVFVALHLLTLMLDPLYQFTPLNLIVPVGEPYAPFAVALGVLALYGLVATLVSSWLRHKMSYGAWRTLHYITFAVFWLVTAHGLLAGSDTGEAWMMVIYIVSAGLVSLGIVARLFWPASAPAPTGYGPLPGQRPLPRRL